MSILKKISAVTAAAAVSASMFAGMTAYAAEDYKYEVVFAEQGAVRKDGYSLSSYSLFGDDGLFIMYEGYDYPKTFSDLTLYYANIDAFRSTGVLSAKKVAVDSKLSEINPNNHFVNGEKLYFSSLDGKTWTYYPAKLDIKNLKLTASDATDSYGEYEFTFKAEDGYKYIYKPRYALRTINVTSEAPDGSSINKAFSYDHISHDDNNLYLSEAEMLSSDNDSARVRLSVTRINSDLRISPVCTNVTLSVPAEHADSQFVVYSFSDPTVEVRIGNTYYMTMQKTVYRYNGETNAFDKFYTDESDAKNINVGKLSDKWLLIENDDHSKTFAVNTETKAEIDLTPYAFKNSYSSFTRISENACSFSGERTVLIDLAKGEVSDAYDSIVSLGNGYFRFEKDGVTSIRDSALKDTGLGGMTHFDENGIALARNNGKAYFVDKTLAQVSEAFDALEIGKLGSLYTSYNRENEYYLAYTDKPVVKLEKVTGLTVKSKSASKVTVTWSAAKNASGYKVEVYKDKKWTKVTITSKTSASVKNLAAGTKYKIRVKPYTKVNGKTVYGSAATVSATTKKK